MSEDERVIYHTNEYINGDGPEWLFFRDDILRLARKAEVDTDDAYQIVFYLNDWFYNLDQELKSGQATENPKKNIPKVIKGLIKIFSHDYTDSGKVFELERKLEDIKEKVEEISEIIDEKELD